jgi:hypothetical protein
MHWRSHVIHRLDATPLDSELWGPLFDQLVTTVLHHAKDAEEAQIFPVAQQVLGEARALELDAKVRSQRATLAGAAARLGRPGTGARPPRARVAGPRAALDISVVVLDIRAAIEQLRAGGCCATGTLVTYAGLVFSLQARQSWASSERC